MSESPPAAARTASNAPPRSRRARGRSAFLGSTLATLLATALASACVASPREGPLARYAAVHNTMSAMGLVQAGPLQRGSLAEGRETKLVLDLPQGCTTLVTLGGAGVENVDVELTDSAGKSIAKDTTQDTEAVVRACVDEAGKYNLSVKMSKGAGDFLAAAWSGQELRKGGGAAAAGSATASISGGGTCDAPSPLGPGITLGSTANGESNFEGTCGTSSAKEIVYRLDVPARQRVSIEVDPRFDAVLYLRKDCTDSGSEVACNDDVSGRSPSHGNTMRPSKVDEVLEAGTYFVFVDGYEEAEGTFKVTVASRDVPTLAQACQRALPLPVGAQVAGSTSTSFDHARAKCGDEAKGNDVVYRLDVPQKSRVRVTEHSDFPRVIHLRKRCGEPDTEVGCSTDSVESEDAAFTGVLEGGQYAVFADASSTEHSGRFTMKAEIGPEQGTGTAGESCPDATPITGIQNVTVDGDTFPARDDVTAKCGGPGGADVVYRIDVAKRSRVRVRMVGEEGSHVFALARSCAEASAQIACGASIEEVVQPGTYYILVDAKDASSFGKFRFEVRSGEVGPQETACRAPQELRPNATVTGTTLGAGDKFTISCAGPVQGQSSPDRIYKLVVAARSRVKLELTTPTWDGVLAIRKSCLDQGNNGPRGNEVECNNDSVDEHHSKIERVMEPGTYFVHVDGHATGNQGPFTLLYTSAAAPR